MLTFHQNDIMLQNDIFRHTCAMSGAKSIQFYLKQINMNLVIFYHVGCCTYCGSSIAFVNNLASAHLQPWQCVLLL